MTEAKWESLNDPNKMLKLLRGKATGRKLRLLICGCSRLISNSMTATQLRQAVEVSELFADEKATEVEREAAERVLREWDAWEANEEVYGCACGAVMADVANNAGPALNAVARAIAFRAGKKMGLKWREKYDAAQIQLASFVRDTFGNPFRPVAVAPSWFTSTVLELARQMYEARDFSPMPVLADALQDAGCDSDDILAHCRSAGPHIRGCWVVDLILGKS